MEDMNVSNTNANKKCTAKKVLLILWAIACSAIFLYLTLRYVNVIISATSEIQRVADEEFIKAYKSTIVIDILLISAISLFFVSFFIQYSKLIKTKCFTLGTNDSNTNYIIQLVWSIVCGAVYLCVFGLFFRTVASLSREVIIGSNSQMKDFYVKSISNNFVFMTLIACLFVSFLLPAIFRMKNREFEENKDVISTRT